MSIRCAIGWHDWKPQYIRLPYRVNQVAIWYFGAYLYESRDFHRGNRCSRCRKWEYQPRNLLAPIEEGATANLGAFGRNYSCNCCTKRGQLS